MPAPQVHRTGPIRYANAHRFARPTAAEVAAPNDTIPPQPPSRLNVIMGPPRDHPRQSEDCLNLSVTAPGFDDQARPVMVWLHGGGFTTGGLLDWYDGGKLAAEGGVVVVNVNYRLGALGYLCRDGVSDGNLGLFDQWEALRWVRANISRYGGDPGNVTVFGQSAGAISVRMLMDIPQARELFHRAILQSGPLSLTRSRTDADSIGSLFTDYLDADPLTASTAEILAAQRDTAIAFAERAGSGIEPPFLPVFDGDPLSSESSFSAHVRGLDVLYGWNLDDMSAFLHQGSDVATATERLFAEPLHAFGSRLAEAGARASAYRLDWRPTGSPFGATHCLELPLLLGTAEAWRHSPMLGEVPFTEVDAFGAAMRAAWSSFAHTGSPDTTATDAWPLSWLAAPASNT